MCSELALHSQQQFLILTIRNPYKVIEIVDLKQQRQPSCRAMVCQLRSKEYEWIKSDGLNHLRLSDKLYNKLLEFLKVAKQNSVDFLVFPELSIPEKFIERIQEWSKEQGAIVVCGSHYSKTERGLISRCPVIIDGNVFFTEKISPSPLEKSPIRGEGIVPGAKLLKFINTTVGSFSILICSDYLDDSLKATLNLHDLDILCVPAFQKDSEVYYRRMAIDCENSTAGIYLLYSNFLDPKHGDGKSAVFGVMDKLFSDKLLEKNFTDLEPDKKLIQFDSTFDYVIVDINLLNKRPYVNRNINTEPNLLVVAHNRQNETKDLSFIQKVAHDDERYKRIDDLFVPPIEFDKIVEILNKKNIVFIIGDPGIGKTYTAAKILKKYYEMGFEPIWFAGLEKEEREMQSRVLSNFSPTDKQIVYFEDPFGRTIFERRDSLFQVFSPLIDKLSLLDSKVVITSRTEVFETFSKESLLERDILDLKNELNIRKPSYDSQGLRAIFDKLASITCDWYDQKTFRELVYSAIQEKRITTPLAVRDLVFVSRHVTSLQVLTEQIERRENDTIKVFALEILTSSVTIRTILFLIFYCGSKGKPFLTIIYANVSKQLSLMNYAINSFSFNVEIRTQLGYRIEQLGSIRTAYKFSHPVYEEALAALAISDTTSETISKLIIQELSKSDIKIAYLIINRLVIKYPEVSLVLFRHLLETHGKIKDKSIRLTLSQKLISTYYATRKIDFFELASQLFSIEEAITDINKPIENWHDTIQKLKLVERYLYNSPENFNSTIAEKILWDSLFIQKTENFLNSGQILHLLIVCSSINPNSVAIFIEKKGINLIKRTYLLLDKNGRTRFYNLLGGFAIQHEFNKYKLKIDELEKDYGKKKSQLLRRVVFSEQIYYGVIEIDDGAARALRKNWVNLLPVGISKIHGDFPAGSIVKIVSQKKAPVGVGIVEYSSEDLRKIMRRPSSEFQEYIGYYHSSAAIKSNLLNRFKFTRPLEPKMWQPISKNLAT